MALPQLPLPLANLLALLRRMSSRLIKVAYTQVFQSLISFVTTQVQIFTSSGATGGKAITSATATPSPALSVTTAIASATSFTATGSYALGQAYQFTISRTNANGTSAISGISSSITPNP